MSTRVPDIPQGVTRNIPRALLGWFNEIKRLLQLALDSITAGGAPANLTYVSSSDDSAILPNSRRLTDTATVTWDFGTPNQAKANAVGGAGLVDGDYGDVNVGGSGTTMTIDANAVSNGKLAQMPAHTYKGNPTGAVADPTDATAAQVLADLADMVGSGASHARGIVPDPGAVAGTTKFLREDGTWATPAGGGGSNPGPLVWLATLPLAGLTNADFVLTASLALGYKHFQWKLDQVEPTTDLQNLLVNFSTDGGATYNNAAGNYRWADHAISTAAGSAAQGSASATDIILNDNGNTIGNVANEGFTGDLDIINPATTGRETRAMWRGLYKRGSDGLLIGIANGCALRNTNQDTDAVRFRWSGGGTFAAGTITLYGINETTGPGSTPGVITKGQATIDFGAFPGAQEASLAITGQTAITATSWVEAQLLVADSADHSADEHRAETIEIRVGTIVAGTGFTIYAINVNPVTGGPTVPQLYGLYNVQWAWSN